MAGFKMHISTSTVLGVGYGAGAYLWYGVPWDQCLLAGTLCSVSGMLPDIDSDNGVPLRESLAFGAAVVPMLLVDRFRHMGMTTDAIVLCGAMIYLAIRFGLGKILRSYTVHRGMFHSIPAGLIFAELAYLMCDCESTALRLFKAGGVLVGFMSHLILDEIYSIEWHRGRLRLKKSFGTALKVWGRTMWSNISTYGKLALLTYMIVSEPMWMKNLGQADTHVAGEEKAQTGGEAGQPAVAESLLERFSR